MDKAAHKDGEQPAHYQLAQYVCQYNAELRSVTCQPFVRTFMTQGHALVEVTPHVNQGGRLPPAEALRKATTTQPLIEPIGDARPPPAS
ncbi:hypothetical protein JCM10207_008924 [Rhodosporidiobolus poonsookiae]